MELLEKQETEVSGVVKKYLSNKHGDVDAFEIQTDEKAIKINFPPHTAKTIKTNAVEGTFATVVYQSETKKDEPAGDKKAKLKLVSISGIPTGELIVKDLKPQKSADEPVAETLTLTEYELLKGKKGELTGIKHGNKLFHVHKEDQELSDIIKPGAALEITAVKRMDDGFVNEHNDEVFHIKKLSTNGLEYKSKK